MLSDVQSRYLIRLGKQDSNYKINLPGLCKRKYTAVPLYQTN